MILVHDLNKVLIFLVDGEKADDLARLSIFSHVINFYLFHLANISFGATFEESKKKIPYQGAYLEFPYKQSISLFSLLKSLFDEFCCLFHRYLMVMVV